MTCLAVLFTACQTKTAEDTADSIATAPDTTLATADTQTCYAYTKDKDTVSLTLKAVGNEVTGQLDYNLYEKDKNSGTITGLIKGDTIIADYTFMSEGINSTRQVAFLKKDGSLIEGYGPSSDQDGKVIFTTTAGIKFDGSTTLTEVPCK